MEASGLKSKIVKWYYLLPIEAFVWIIGILILTMYNPYVQDHFSVCFFDWVGFKYCPGCGLGRSVSFLLHGDVSASFRAHPLGFIALILLSFRSGKLLYFFLKELTTQKHNNNG